MKKGIALAMTALLLLVLTVPTFAAEANTATVLYKANQIVDPNLLMMRAELGVDERSDAVKRVSSINVTTNIQLDEPEILNTTQLVERRRLEDGTIEETYSTVGVARSALSSIESATQNSITIYAVVNYTTTLVGDTLIQARYDGSEHRVLHPSAAEVDEMYILANIDDGLDSLYRNTRTIYSPGNGVWYGLNGPSSRFFDLHYSFIAYTSVEAAGVSNLEVNCEVDLHSEDPFA